MYYVSDIITDSGKKLNSVTYWPFNSVPHFEAEVTNTDTGEKFMVASRELGNIVCIGYGRDNGVVRGLADSVLNEVVVRHTLKSALLHKYVLESRSIVGTEVADSCEIDSFIYGNKVSNNGHGKTVGVDTASETYIVCGSSVIHRRGFDGIRFTKTLYQVLGDMCRECNTNLMSYERIVLFSRTHNVTTDIRLLKTDESQRFFTKMFLDVMHK